MYVGKYNIHGWYRISFISYHVSLTTFVSAFFSPLSVRLALATRKYNLPPAPATGCVHAIMRCFSQLVSEKEALKGKNPDKVVYHDMVF